jgi:hypothetical protein
VTSEKVVPKCYKTELIDFWEIIPSSIKIINHHIVHIFWVNRRTFRRVKSLCPTTTIPSRTIDTNIVPAPTAKVLIELSSIKLLTPSEGCGFSNATHDKIVGGGDALIGEWPWMALLGYQNDQGKVSFRCAASIITARHLLTAAHCLRSNL